MVDSPLLEASRQFKICNACRYCEGYCAVWPAMERRTTFEEKDVIFLANLCYNCRDCFTACPFTPPHEFNINIPKVMSEVRLLTYESHVSPKSASAAFAKPRKTTSLFALSMTALMFLFSSIIGNPTRLFSAQTGLGSFYVIIPYWIIIASGLIAGGYVLLAYFLDIQAFCKKIHGSFGDFFRPKIVWQALGDVMKHTYFKGGGTGCSYPREKGNYSFLTFHVMVFYGFLLAIVSTVSASVYQDVLGILPPYGILSLPVIFGTIGGALMIIGASALLFLNAKSDNAPSLTKMLNLDTVFLITLDLVSFTGFLTLLLRMDSAMGTIFLIHLALVLTLFLTAPYGKFVHFIYRFAALENDRFEMLSKSSH